MARTVDVERRRQLLDAVVGDLLERGLVDASLDRLATAAGTSARMLVHHFGGRRALLDAALASARTHELARAREALAAGPDFLARVAGAWTWFGSAEAAQYFRLFGQVAALTRLDPGHDSGPSRPALTTEWLDLATDGFVAAGYEPAAARETATVFIAQVRGLVLDLEATADHSRVAAAYDRFVCLLINPRGDALPE